MYAPENKTETQAAAATQIHKLKLLARAVEIVDRHGGQWTERLPRLPGPRRKSHRGFSHPPQSLFGLDQPLAIADRDDDSQPCDQQSPFARRAVDAPRVANRLENVA